MTRRPNGMGSVSRRRNGAWCGQIDLGADPDTGKRRRRTVYGRTPSEVETKMKALLRQLDVNGDLPTSDVRLSKWLTDWLEGIARDRVKPTTFPSYRTAVNRYLVPSIGNRPLSRLTTAHVRQMHAFVRAQGCNSTTARNAHRILSVALNDAVREGKVGRNVASLVRAPAKAVSKRGSLSYDEALAILAKTEERTAARWLAAFAIGARQGELLGLRWDYVDLHAGEIDLAWSLQRVAYEHGCNPRCAAKTGKGCPQRYLPIPEGFEYERLGDNQALCLLRPKTDSSRRVVPLSDVLWAALRLHAEKSVREPNPHGLVWTRPDGRPIHPRDDWQAWSDLLKTAGIERRVTLHEARHATASWLADADVPENVSIRLMGHSDVTTNRGYQHLSTATGRAALNRIGSRLILPAAT